MTYELNLSNGTTEIRTQDVCGSYIAYHVSGQKDKEAMELARKLSLTTELLVDAEKGVKSFANYSGGLSQEWAKGRQAICQKEVDAFSADIEGYKTILTDKKYQITNG